jgi:hypothetical protein
MNTSIFFSALLLLATAQCRAQVVQIAGNDFQGGTDQLPYSSTGDTSFFVGTANGNLLFAPVSSGGTRTVTFDSVNLQNWSETRIQFDFAVVDLAGGVLENSDTFSALLETNVGSLPLMHNVSNTGSSSPSLFTGNGGRGPFIGTFFIDIPASVTFARLFMQATTSGEAFAVDNVRFIGVPTPAVPEPGVLVLMTAGICGGVLCRRK